MDVLDPAALVAVSV
jgi:hypothetical protein